MIYQGPRTSAADRKATNAATAARVAEAAEVDRADTAQLVAQRSATSSLAGHVAAANPHTVYQLGSEKGQPDGYAELGSGGLVPVSQLGSGTPDGTKFLRDDGVFAEPQGGGGSGLTQAQVFARLSIGGL